MMLTSYGCSFMFGTDLADSEMIPNTPGRPSQHTWPALLAQRLELSYQCRAYPGCGNLLIAERILLDLQQENFACNSLLVSDRFDYNDAGKKDNWNTLRPSETHPLNEMYYKNFHSEYRDKLTSLMTMLLIIDLLQDKNIPFLMTCMDDVIFDRQWHASASIQTLQDQVEPHIIKFDNMNFLSWSQNNQFAISTALHPLEQAHEAAAKYIFSHKFT